jgi:hypothetical protein
MNGAISKLTSWLKRHVWFIAAFFIPLAIRSIPEILSWPYPLGLDTLTMVRTIQSGSILLSGPWIYIHSQLFYTFQTLTYWLIGNIDIVIKIFGPLLMGCVSLMMYLYARHGLGWSGFKSFLVALLVGIYFVSLRNSWDLYAQSFALIFLLSTLVLLKAYHSKWRYPVIFTFMFLTVFGHQLVSVIMFFILGLEAIRLLIKGSKRESLYLFISLFLAGSFFLFRTYSPQTNAISIPAADVSSAPPISFVFFVGGLLLYCYVLILPLVALGFRDLKDSILKYWIVWCTGIPLLLAIFPNLPLYYWNRWVYLLVYPLLFFAVAGLDKLWHLQSGCKIKVKRLLPKVVAVVYVAFLLALSGFYLAASPENQISLFSTANPYLSFIPSSMLQNTLPISDNPALLNCFNWVNAHSSNDSAVIVHYALYDLASIYVHSSKVISINQDSSMWIHLNNETVLVDGIIGMSRQALVNGNSSVYTVWWVDGEGWYKVSALPPEFTQVSQFGRMAVYVFNSTA